MPKGHLGFGNAFFPEPDVPLCMKAQKKGHPSTGKA